MRASAALSLLGLRGPNPAEGMGVSLLCLLCVVQVVTSAMGRSLVQSSHTGCGSSSCVRSRNINPLTSNDHCRCRTAPLTSKRCILYIYSTNIGTEYFKHGIYSPFFFSSKCSLLHNSNYLVPVLFTFYIQDVLKLKIIIPATKG